MLTHFERLWNDLPSIRERVARLELGNDRMEKAAIVGYSYHRPIELWGRDESEFVARRRDEVADFDPRWIEFVCLASGYVIGLFQAGTLTETECALFEAQLPGFMWLHSERFTG